MRIRVSIQVNNRTFCAVDKSVKDSLDLSILIKEVINKLSLLSFSSILEFSRRSS